MINTFIPIWLIEEMTTEEKTHLAILLLLIIISLKTGIKFLAETIKSEKDK